MKNQYAGAAGSVKVARRVQSIKSYLELGLSAFRWQSLSFFATILKLDLHSKFTQLSKSVKYGVG